jgi:hypothetical protein
VVNSQSKVVGLGHNPFLGACSTGPRSGHR